MKANSLAAGVEAGQLYPRRRGIFRPLTIVEQVLLLRYTSSYNRRAAFANSSGTGQEVLKVRAEWTGALSYHNGST
jgi:hypothetical protein